MAFFTFDQNNSGGSFVYDKGKGLTTYVVVEAPTAEKANALFEVIGGYFNGCETGQDCDCCGDRWSETGEWNAKPEPTVYGRPVAEARPPRWVSGKHIAVHYADGRIEWHG